MSQRHIPGENPEEHCCENLKILQIFRTCIVLQHLVVYVETTGR